MKNISIALLSFLLLGCSENGNVVTEEDVVTLDMAAIDMPDVANPTNDETISTKKIITTDIQISVENIAKSKIQIDKIIRESKAEISEETSSNNTINIKFYVPRKNYETVVNAFNEETFDVLDSKSTHITNITKEYYALKNQLNSDAILVAKYQELLKKSTGIEDVLTIYERIENLELEQRNHNDLMAYYNKMQDYNLVTVMVNKIGTEDNSRGFFYQSFEALSEGLTLIKDFFIGLLTIWPFLIIFSVLIFGLKKYRTKKNKS